MKKVHLNVQGMECDACVQHVLNAVLSVNGTASASVSLEYASADISYDETKIDPSMIITAIEEDGYQAAIAAEE